MVGRTLSVVSQNIGARPQEWVIEALRAGSRGTFDLPTGTIYPALHRLERAGFVGSRWNVVSGRRRRDYELTSSGRPALSSERAVWAQFSTAVPHLFANQPWPTAS